MSQYSQVTTDGLEAFLEGMDTSRLEVLVLPGLGLGEDRPADALGGDTGDPAQPEPPGDGGGS